MGPCPSSLLAALTMSLSFDPDLDEVELKHAHKFINIAAKTNKACVGDTGDAATNPGRTDTEKHQAKPSVMVQAENERLARLALR